jgi:hypothetical protein
MPDFIPGLQLSEAYYREAVRPVLDEHFPGLRHSAALIGYGSDTAGYDTPVSRDHLWGPRLMLFLPPADFDANRAVVYEALRRGLPVQFRGYSTHFSKPDLEDGGTRVMEYLEQGPVEPLIDFYTIAQFWNNTLGVAPDAEFTPADWLTFGEQGLLELTGGKVFHDDLGLEAARARLAYYPQDVWLYLLSAQWLQISQEEAFVGRTQQVGDLLGSRVVAARMVERLMRLCFMMEKRYAPYSKWFGTAFQRLECAPRMGPLLEGALAAASYAECEQRLAPAYTLAAEMHNALGITPPLETRTRTYSGWHALRGGITELPIDSPRDTRPHQVIFGGRFADAIAAAIRDPRVLALLPGLGSVNQFMIESSDALQNTDFRRRIKPLLVKDPE